MILHDKVKTVNSFGTDLSCFFSSVHQDQTAQNMLSDCIDTLFLTFLDILTETRL